MFLFLSLLTYSKIIEDQNTVSIEYPYSTNTGSYEKIYSFLAELNVTIKKIGDNMEKLNDRMERLENRMERLENRMERLENRTERLENRMERLEDDVSGIKQSINEHSGKYALQNSAFSNGFIIVNLTNDEHAYGSGNLVSFQNKLYFCTCLHVIYDELLNKTLAIHKIILDNNMTLTPTGNVIVDSTFSTGQYMNYSFDFALIEVENKGNISQFAANISRTQMKLGDKIQGIINFYKGRTFAEGIVKEKEKEVNIFQASIGGMGGFSGAGYFNTEGNLQAIHRASGTIFGESISDTEFYSDKEASSKRKPLHKLIAKTMIKCLKSINFTHLSISQNIPDSINSTGTKKCVNAIYDSIHNISRNPRSEVLDASYLIKLLDKKSNTGKIIKIDYTQ